MRLNECHFPQPRHARVSGSSSLKKPRVLTLVWEGNGRKLWGISGTGEHVLEQDLASVADLTRFLGSWTGELFGRRCEGETPFRTLCQRVCHGALALVLEI